MNAKWNIVSLVCLLSATRAIGGDGMNTNGSSQDYTVAAMLTNLLNSGELAQITALADRGRQLSLSELRDVNHTLMTNGTSVILTLVLTNGGSERVTYNDGEPTSLSLKSATGAGFDVSYFSGRIRDVTKFNKYKSSDIDFMLRLDRQGNPVHFCRFSGEGRVVRVHQWDANGIALPTVEQDLSKSPLHLFGRGIQQTNTNAR